MSLRPLPKKPKDANRWGHGYSWDDLLDSMDFTEILVSESTHDYQGDTFVLAKDIDRQFVIVTYGWGSCSGCDALEGCDDAADVTQLRDDIYDGASWFSTREEVLAYLDEIEKASGNHWQSYENTFKRFAEQVRIALTPPLEPEMTEDPVTPVAPEEIAEVRTSVQKAWNTPSRRKK